MSKPCGKGYAVLNPSSFFTLERSQVQYVCEASRTFCLFVSAGLDVNRLAASDAKPIRYAALYGILMVRAFTSPADSKAFLNSDHE